MKGKVQRGKSKRNINININRYSFLFAWGRRKSNKKGKTIGKTKNLASFLREVLGITEISNDKAYIFRCIIKC